MGFTIMRNGIRLYITTSVSKVYSIIFFLFTHLPRRIQVIDTPRITHLCPLQIDRSTSRNRLSISDFHSTHIGTPLRGRVNPRILAIIHTRSVHGQRLSGTLSCTLLTENRHQRGIFRRSVHLIEFTVRFVCTLCTSASHTGELFSFSGTSGTKS